MEPRSQCRDHPANRAPSFDDSSLALRHKTFHAKNSYSGIANEISRERLATTSQWRRSRSIVSIVAAGIGRRSRCGREERSCNPVNPSRRYRSIHFRMVRRQTPVALATALRRLPALDLPDRFALDRAASAGILVDAHSILRESLKLRQPQLSRSVPDGQPTESSPLAGQSIDWRHFGRRSPACRCPLTATPCTSVRQSFTSRKR